MINLEIGADVIRVFTVQTVQFFKHEIRNVASKMRYFEDRIDLYTRIDYITQTKTGIIIKIQMKFT